MGQPLPSQLQPRDQSVLVTAQSYPSGTFYTLLPYQQGNQLYMVPTGQFQNMSLQGCMLPPPYQTLPPTGQAYEPTAPPSSIRNNLTGIAVGQKGSPQYQPLANSAPQHSQAAQYGQPPHQ